MKTRIKGNRSVRRAIDYYEQQGWLVDKAEKTGKFIKDKDLYNLFDLVAVKENTVLFIQVKTNRPPTKKSFCSFAKTYAGPNLFVHAFTWYDRRGAVIHDFRNSGKVTKEDLRK